MPSHCAALTRIEFYTWIHMQSKCTLSYCIAGIAHNVLHVVNNVLTYSLIHTQFPWVTESCSEPSDQIACIAKKLDSNITWHDVSLRYFAPAWLVAVNKILVWTDIAEFQEVPLIACKIHENNSLDKTWTNNAHLRDHTCFGNIAEIWRGSNHVSSSLFFLYLPPGQVFVSVAGGSTKQITYAEGMPSYANRVNMLKVSYGVAPAA